MIRYTHQSMQIIDQSFLILCSLFFIICILIAISPWGKIRLGKEKPEFSRAAWLSMLFAAGMGSGICFWGSAEPLIHSIVSPGTKEAGSTGAISFAFALTHFHWGFHAWAIYAINALCLAYFAFNRGGKLLASTPIKKILPGYTGNILGNIADVLAVLAVTFGVAGSLGMGSRQISSGIKLLFAHDASIPSLSLIILILMTLAYLLSASTKIDRGIKILSKINLIVAMALLVYIFFVGPTGFIIKNLFTGTVAYLQEFFHLSTELLLKNGSKEWSYDWTMTYLIWWVAWTPFVGIFIARISRGRTIREFMLGILLVPTLFTIIWFSAFGATSIHLLQKSSGTLSEVALNTPAQVLFEVLSFFPFSSFVSIIAMILLFIFLVTSADSASFVLGMMTSKGSLQPHKAKKILWGIIMALLTASAIMAGGQIKLMKAMAISGAVPFFIIMILQTSMLIKDLLSRSKK